MKKSYSLFLLPIIMLLSCTVYQASTVSLNDALSMGKAEVHKKNGDVIVVKDIMKIEGNYYIIQKRDTIALEPSEVEKIYLQNYPASNVISLVLIAIPVAIIVIIYNCAFGC